MSAPIQKSASKRKAATQVVTANRLIDGVVVYLDADGGWSDRIGQAVVLEADADIEAALATGQKAVEAQIIVEAYAIDVARDADGALRPLRLREVIRAFGPTVRDDLARSVAA
ncbi:DUF2849 domain-containing protein [Methylopila sp. M107]|uniref:DUF2849 domain-containing protein n=1 Tax=Methylopila sp. M107 TaxID=1101190 RepID=UPI00037C0F94|nr:DUF2849 domain-containing protein [Methylopila sp. M107]